MEHMESKAQEAMEFEPDGYHLKLLERAEKAEAELADIKQSLEIIHDDQGADDEVHCSCCAPLRMMLQNAEAKINDLQFALDRERINHGGTRLLVSKILEIASQARPDECEDAINQIYVLIQEDEE